ncbi:MAG: cytochrome P450, partial [Acidimicrobiia bacterium]|nr:cytochrome P450 [Acidimicrobiia bacterium]
MARPEVDLLDPSFHVGDPHPAYRWMRQHEPIYRDEGNRLWAMTRMEHLRHVERHTEAFSSNHGYRSVWIPTETSMISKDDPAHSAQRKLIADRFTPRAVNALEDQVRSIVTQALGTFIISDRFEVVDTLAARVPSMLTARLVGWPDERWRDVRSWSERLMRVDTMARDAMHASDGIRAVFEIAGAVDPLYASRKACPVDDLMSVWAQAMSVEEINSELGLFIPGGAETTRTTLARALILFSERNDLWEQLAAAPATISTAVEELLRCITPLNTTFRTVTEEAEL